VRQAERSIFCAEQKCEISKKRASYIKTSNMQNIMYKEFEQNDCTEKWLRAKQAGLAALMHIAHRIAY